MAKTCETIAKYLQSLPADSFLQVSSTRTKVLGRGLDHKKLVMDFLTQLGIYQLILRRLSKKITLNQRYSEAVQRSLNNQSIKFLVAANRLEKGLRFDSQKLEIRELFRSCVSDFIFSSELLKRYYLKPQGYPGDYMMFETIYNNKPTSVALGYYIDKFVLDYSLAQSMINRKNLMKKFLFDAISKFDKGRINILNLGCGSCREVRELIGEKRIKRSVKFLFVDQDRDGLQFAETEFGSPPSNIKLEFFQRNLYSMVGFGSNSIPDALSKQHVIYSMGVIDYFGDRMLLHFVQYCLRQLSRGGQLILASCSSRNLSIYSLLTWYCEWHFYKRDALRTKALILDNLRINDVRLHWESQKNVFFLVITK